MLNRLRLGILLLVLLLTQVLNFMPSARMQDPEVRAMLDDPAIEVTSWIGSLILLGTIVHAIRLMRKKCSEIDVALPAALIVLTGMVYSVLIFALSWEQFLAYMTISGRMPLVLTWLVNAVLLWALYKSIMINATSGR